MGNEKNNGQSNGKGQRREPRKMSIPYPNNFFILSLRARFILEGRELSRIELTRGKIDKEAQDRDRNAIRKIAVKAGDLSGFIKKKVKQKTKD